MVLTFIGWAVLLPSRWAVPVALGWGLCLLAGITYWVARTRQVRPWPEILKHVAVAVLVITVSRVAAMAIFAWLSP